MNHGNNRLIFRVRVNLQQKGAVGEFLLQSFGFPAEIFRRNRGSVQKERTVLVKRRHDELFGFDHPGLFPVGEVQEKALVDIEPGNNDEEDDQYERKIVQRARSPDRPAGVSETGSLP